MKESDPTVRLADRIPAAAGSRHDDYRPAGVRRSDRSDVGCTHTEGCPLFPYLNASLRGWRDYYCDSEDRWLDCARYQKALTGKPVPISLLPNGRDAQHLKTVAEADRSHVTPPSAAEPQTSPIPILAMPERVESPAVPEQRAEPGEPPKRRWWSRIAEWMRGPA